MWLHDPTPNDASWFNFFTCFMNCCLSTGCVFGLGIECCRGDPISLCPCLLNVGFRVSCNLPCKSHGVERVRMSEISCKRRTVVFKLLVLNLKDGHHMYELFTKNKMVRVCEPVGSSEIWRLQEALTQRNGAPIWMGSPLQHFSWIPIGASLVKSGCGFMTNCLSISSWWLSTCFRKSLYREQSPGRF